MSESGFLEKCQNYGVLDRQLTNKERWVGLWVLFTFGFTTAYGLLKASSALMEIGAVFGFELANVGYIMSVFTLACIVFAFPGAWLIRNFGVKSTCIAAVAITLVGSVLGVFSTNPGMFLVSRVLEGTGYGLASVIGPNLMTRLFPLEKQGLVMGIWSLWFPTGAAVAFAIVPPVYGLLGWQGLWYVSIILEVIVFVWLLFWFKMPAVAENILAAQAAEETRAAAGGKKQKSYVLAAVLIALTFLIWCFAYTGAINTFYPTYLQTVKGMSMTMSSNVPLLINVITIPFGIWFGVLADKTNTRKWFAAIPYLVIAIMVVTFAYSMDDNMVAPWVFACILGLCSAAVPMGTRSIIPVLVQDPRKADYILAAMTFATGVGIFLGGLFYGKVVDAVGFYWAGIYMLLPMLLVAFIILISVKSDKKVIKEREEAEQEAA